MPVRLLFIQISMSAMRPVAMYLRLEATKAMLVN